MVVEVVWAVWGAVDRSPTSACYVMFGSVITVEEHTADAGASQHTNNTVELSGFVEALQFSLPQEPAPRGARAHLLRVTRCCRCVPWFHSAME